MRDSLLRLDGVEIEVVRKDVMHVRISVHPPDGAVRVSAPRHLRERELARIVGAKLQWIRRKQAEVAEREPLQAAQYVTGEMHPYRGNPCRLLVVEAPGRAAVRLLEGGTLEVRVPPGSTRELRARALERWYRERLAEAVQPLLAEWEPRLGVSPSEVRIRRMTTRWGSCSIRAQRIWLNLELIKRCDACLEYVLVHELVHLLEASHGPRFKALMDIHMPLWRDHRAALKTAL